MAEWRLRSSGEPAEPQQVFGVKSFSKSAYFEVKEKLEKQKDNDSSFARGSGYCELSNKVMEKDQTLQKELLRNLEICKRQERVELQNIERAHRQTIREIMRKSSTRGLNVSPVKSQGARRRSFPATELKRKFSLLNPCYYPISLSQGQTVASYNYFDHLVCLQRKPRRSTLLSARMAALNLNSLVGATKIRQSHAFRPDHEDNISEKPTVSETETDHIVSDKLRINNQMRPNSTFDRHKLDKTKS